MCPTASGMTHGHWCKQGPPGLPTPLPLCPHHAHCRHSAPPRPANLRPEGRNSNKRKKLGRRSSSLKKQMKSHHLSPVVSGTDNIFQSVIAVNCTFPQCPSAHLSWRDKCWLLSKNGLIINSLDTSYRNCNKTRF